MKSRATEENQSTARGKRSKNVFFFFFFCIAKAEKDEREPNNTKQKANKRKGTWKKAQNGNDI